MRTCLLVLALVSSACGEGSAPEPDAGDTSPDAGGTTPDGGDTTPDSGDTTPDAGDTTPDAGDTDPEPSSNVIENGGFEEWTAALEGWSGSTTNLPAEAIQLETGNVFEGANAVRLINTTGTHKRFTTAPRSLAAGTYDCTFQVRGSGEIRNAYFDGDYSSYSSYVQLDAASWIQLSYTFVLAADVVDTFELIFSLRNTSGDHLVLDDVRCALPAN